MDDMSQKYPLVTKVNEDRWGKAQNWERLHWCRTQKMRSKYGKNVIWRLLAFLGLMPKHRGDDWNYWWKRHFNNYEFLPQTIENAIELGCGPYTNMRLIIERCQPKHLFLNDPLIKDYVDFKLTFLSEMYRKKQCILDDHPCENCPFPSDYFDLTVMINLLDHAQDAKLCINNAIRITKPDGILIIGQDLTNEKDMRKIENSGADVGHPIKLNHQYLDKLLLKEFTVLIHKTLSRQEGRAPDHHYGTYIFAGKKESTKVSK